MGMKDKQLAKEIAERCMRMIAQLVGVLSSPEEYYEKRREISVMYEISTRTLWRYVDAYNECGMDGLEPKGKVPGQNVIVSKELLAEAIRLRREVPSRSVPTIIQILELEGKVTPGTLKRTTLQRALAGAGYSTAMMKMYQDNGYGSQRFQRVHRCDLWQGDIKYGPTLRIGGKMQPTAQLLQLFADAARLQAGNAAQHCTGFAAQAD